MIRHQDKWFTKPFENYFWILPEGSEPPGEVCHGPLPFVILHAIPSGLTLPEHSLVVIDDMQQEQNRELVLLHTIYSHHRDLTCISLVHSLFPKNKFHRDLTQSTKYIYVKANPRDKQAFQRLAVQLQPGRARELVGAYTDACSRPYGHLMVDLTQRIHPALRYRAPLPPDSPDDDGVCVYATERDVEDLIREVPSRYERLR